MLSTLDIRRLAQRIDRLVQTRTRGWHPGDELEFRRKMPGSRGADPRRTLPDPDELRDWADRVRDGDTQVMNVMRRQWPAWLQMVLDLEAMASRNDPRNPARAVRDLARGRLPRHAALLLEAALILQGRPVHAKADPQFTRWVETQTFVHPQTRNKVKFVSLPPQEQARIRSRWDQQKQQAEAQRGGEKKDEKDPWEGLPERESKDFKKWLSEQDAEAQKAWEAPGNDAARRDLWQKFKKDRGRKPTTEEQLRDEEKKAPPPPTRKPEESQESLAKRREKLFETPRDARPDEWVRVDRGNSLWGPSAELGEHADVKDSRISGTVGGSAKVTDSTIETGTRVEGTARVERSLVDEFAIVEGDAEVTGSQVSGRARVRGDTKIRGARIMGGTWDGQEIRDGKGGLFHEAWDQETLDILTSIGPKSAVFGHRAPPGVPGPGDGPLLSMVRYLQDGGRTKGWLGGKFDRKKIERRIQEHVYDNYDRKNPWLGRGASHLDQFSDEDFAKLMETAQKEADRRKAEQERKKRAMLHHLAKAALDDPSLRPGLVPLVRLARDFRVASGEIDFRGAAIRYAYACPDARVRAAVVRAVATADRVRVEIPTRSEGDLEIMPEQYRELVRLAYTTSSVERRRRILAMIRLAKYSPGFMKWVEKQTFKHPETGNDVKFISLPPAERKKIHDQWKAGKKEWAQKFKPPGLSEETVLTPQKFDDLKEGDVLWISWTPGMLHRVTGFEKTKTGKPVLEMALVDPKTGKDVDTRYLHRSSTEKDDYEIHVVPPKGAEKAEEKKPEEKKPEKAEEKEKEEGDKLPGPAATWKEMKESGLLDALVGPGAKATSFVSEYARGDVITATLGDKGVKADFTVLGKFVIKGEDGTEYVLAQGEHGPTVVPFQGPGAKGVKIKVKEKAEGKPKKKPAKPKKKPSEEKPEAEGPAKPSKKETKERVEKTQPKALPELSDEEGEKLDQEFSELLQEWEGGAADFEHLEHLGKTYYGDKFDADVHKAMLGWAGDWFSDLAADLRREKDEQSHASAALFQNLADDVEAKAKAIEPKKPKEKEHEVPSTPKERHTERVQGATDVKGYDVAAGDTVYLGGKPVKVVEAVEDPDKYGNLVTLENGQKVNTLLLDGPKDSGRTYVKKGEPSADEKHEPTGKYKDRKELLGKALKKGGPDTKIKPPKRLVDLAAPEGMDPEVREKTVERMKDLSLGEAKKLLGHLKKAISEPEGAYAKAMLDSGYTAEGIKKLHEALRARVLPYQERKYAEPVLEMANKYDLEAEDADELFDFRVDKPPYGKKLTDAELFQKFLAKAKPETRERMQGMSLTDFMVMYKSIMAEEDEEEGEAAAAA